MSLELAARHLAAQGRGPDSRLVHMSPREVAGLQALAMAHGGSLSVNPRTGLPEAGFLDQLLPMLIGVGVTAATGGAAAPWMLGLGVGGFEAARTGNIGKGLLAGLGAYGGAGLAGGLLGAGAAGAGAADTGAQAAFRASEIAAQNAGAGAAPAAPSMAGVTGGAGVAAPQAIAQQAAQQAAPAIPFGGTEAQMAQAYFPEAATVPPPATSMPTIPATGGADMYADAANAYTPTPTPAQTAAAVPTTPTPAEPPSFTSRLQQMGRGIEGLTTEEGRKAFLAGTEGGKKAAMYGAAAGLPLLITQPKPLVVPKDTERYQYTYDPGRIGTPEARYPGGEYKYFDPRYTRRAADGGMMQANPYSGNAYAFAPITSMPGMMPGPTPMPSIGAAVPGAGAGAGDDDYTYVYDPITKTYKRIPKAPVAAAAPASPFGIDTSGAGMGGEGGGFSGGVGGGSYSGVSSADFDAANQGEASTGDASTGDVGVAGFGYGTAGGDISVGDASTGDVGVAGFGYGGGEAGGDAAGGGDGEAHGGIIRRRYAYGGLAALANGGMYNLGGYSDGGRLLRGPGDGVSDSIPAVIGQKQPARLADGEFVVPARIVSELGNGSTDAGARKLYAMMDRIQKARRQTTGKGKVAKNSKAEKYLPA